MSNEPAKCGKPAAFLMSGIGHGTCLVCLDCAEKAKQVGAALGVYVNLDPDVSDGAECEQKMPRRTSNDP